MKNKSEIYYKIGKNKRYNLYTVLKYKQYKGKIFVKEIYFNKDVLKCISFCACSRYKMKGLVYYE